MIAKRALDVSLAAVLLVALCPVFFFLTLVIKRDGGPAIYRHWRIGMQGVEFPCLKFRTMAAESEAILSAFLAQNAEARAEWVSSFKLRNDPRITKIGAFLRRTSLDELPQLINVLVGEMSLVGPRPVVRAELAKYGAASTVYLSVRPGITGLWQTSGRNAVDYDTRVAMDIRYVQHWSIWTDFVILLKTPQAMLSGV